jgi:hypothetical protein
MDKRIRALNSGVNDKLRDKSRAIYLLSLHLETVDSCQKWTRIALKTRNAPTLYLTHAANLSISTGAEKWKWKVSALLSKQLKCC